MCEKWSAESSSKDLVLYVVFECGVRVWCSSVVFEGGVRGWCSSARIGLWRGLEKAKNRVRLIFSKYFKYHCITHEFEDSFDHIPQILRR